MEMLRSLVRNSGMHPGRLISAWRGWNQYRKDRAAFLALSGVDVVPLGRELPMLMEYGESAGSVGPYMIQDAEAARWVLAYAPGRHVDIGSRIDGFIGHLTVFREVDVIDIRDQPIMVPGARFHKLDLMSPLPDAWIESADSVSCLHTIEHFGLGRYGDSVNPRGHLEGLAQIKRMVAPGGRLLISVPMGPERVEFNAHRIFALPTILGWFGQGWTIERFAYVDDAVNLHSPSNWLAPEAIQNFGCRAGIAMLQAVKHPR